MSSKTQANGLDLIGIRLGVDGKQLLAVSAEIGPGEVLTIMGASGSGKSSLLAYVGGFLNPDFSASGKVLLDGRDLTGLRIQDRRIGMMFQRPLLFPHMSVLENLLFALPSAVKSRKARQEKAEAALASVGLEGFGHRDPARLSGGQQTRVALVRMLLADPGALLLDEPFSSLDASRRAQVRTLVFERARAARLPVLLVTHDPEDAEAAGGRIITLPG